MKQGGVTDRHAGYSVLTPYKKATSTVTQTMQYSKDGNNWVDLATVRITRSVSRQGGVWQQGITTSLSTKSATILLPPKGFYQLN
jgi:hypothetical protein